MRRLLSAPLLAVLCASGCMPTYVQEDRTDRRERALHLENHTGGSHHCTIVANGRWFQAFSNQLLAIDTTTGRTIGSVDVVPFGEGGAVVDLAVDGPTIWAVSDRTSVVEVDVTVPERPTVGITLSAHELGIEPRNVSLAGGEVWVTGDGGAVRLRDRKRFLTGEPVNRVVQTPAGTATTVRRRIVLLEDGRYLGAASELQPLPPNFGPDGGYLFVLQGQSSAQVGLMTPAFSETTSVAIPGLLRRAKVVGDHLVLVTDVAFELWSLKGGKLVDPQYIKLKGGRDVDILRPNHYAVSGTFGRAMYRLAREGNLDGDTFYNVTREPGLLEIAVTDRTRILAGGREGFWLWRIGGEAELTNKTTEVTAISPRTVSPAWGTAEMVIDKAASGTDQAAHAVSITCGGVTSSYSPDGAPRITAIELVDGDLWVGHERGLDILRKRPDGDPAGPGVKPIHQYKFEGPVLFIFPERIGGGGSVVSLHGGFIQLRPVPVGAEPKFEGRGSVK